MALEVGVFGTLMAFLILYKIFSSPDFVIIASSLFLAAGFVTISVWIIWRKVNRSRLEKHYKNVKTISVQQRPCDENQARNPEPAAAGNLEDDHIGYISLDDIETATTDDVGTHCSYSLGRLPEEISLSEYDEGIDFYEEEPITCDTVASIAPTGNSGDVTISITLRSSEIRKHSTRGHGDVTGRPSRLVKRSKTMPRHASTNINQQRPTLNAGEYLNLVDNSLGHQYMVMTGNTSSQCMAKSEQNLQYIN